MNFNPMDDRLHGPWGFEEGNFERTPRHGRRCDFEDLPFDGDQPRCMPRGFGGHGMPGAHCMPGRPGMPGGPGFPPHGGPGFGGPGRPGFGLPPRRPDPEFLKRRIEDSDVMELIDMAGRMVHRLPKGSPARGQALILSILMGREALSQRELQQMLGIQPGSLSELLSKLEIKGYLTREKAEDKRGNLLRITDAGRAAIPGDGDVPEDTPLSPLTVDQQDQLAALLRTLLTAWVEQLEPPCPRGHRPPQKPVEV